MEQLENYIFNILGIQYSIFLYSIFSEHYFRIFPGISLGFFSEYTANTSREYSTNIPQMYICLVSIDLVRKVTTVVKSSMFDVGHGSISLQFLKNLKLSRLINIEYQHKWNSVTEDYALWVINMDFVLYFMFELWNNTQTLDLTIIKVFHTHRHTLDL